MRKKGELTPSLLDKLLCNGRVCSSCERCFVGMRCADGNHSSRGAPDSAGVRLTQPDAGPVLYLRAAWKLQDSPVTGLLFSPHFTSDKTWAQRGSMTC